MTKTFSKILIILFFISTIFLIVSPANALKEGKNPLDNLQVTIPGLEKLAADHPAVCNEEQCSIPWIGVYIASVFNYAIGIVGILAAVVLMFGGIIWITAGGSAEKIGEAKKWIGASLAGLIIALSSFMILYQINPKLTMFKPLEIKNVKKLDELQRQYSASCPTEDEQKNGYTAFTTGYCKPEASASDISNGYYTGTNFLCKVGLNCTCPNGQNTAGGRTCGSSYAWYPCKQFSVSQSYCNQTASGGEPSSGQVAADWNCAGINKFTTLCIDGKIYQVTDQGGAIKGKRIDIFVDDCDDAGSVTGEKSVKIGGCSN